MEEHLNQLGKERSDFIRYLFVMNYLQDRLLQVLKTPFEWDMADAQRGSTGRHRHPFDSIGCLSAGCLLAAF